MPWPFCDCCRAQRDDIRQLNYQHCVLSDVPPDVFIFERTLEELYLDSNRIRDLPRPLFHCHGLKILSINDNEVQHLPPAIASLINLQFLDLSRNALSDIPDNIKGCKQLKYVDVSVNPLEKLPEGFTQLIALEELYLNDTCLDFLPANFGRLMKLKILELRENNLNILPKSIGRLTNLQRLDLGQNEFSDLPEVVGNLPNLKELWIDYNKIRSLPDFIGNLKELIHLEASNNQINWISHEIGNCSKLVDLTLTCNELQDLPNSLENLKELVTLKVDDNQLCALPITIGKLIKLEELIASQNELINLPPCIGLLRKLSIINVDENLIEELPSEIGSCTNLRILSIANNKLKMVPAEVGHLTNLRVINFCDNQLRNLPVSILNLTQLTALWLSNNQSMPLTMLQQEIDRETHQAVCVNFMLPQTTHETNYTENAVSRRGPSVERYFPPRVKPHIRFANDSHLETHGHLMRAPTPYPKELRAMAKHARAVYHSRKSSKQMDEDSPLLEEIESQNGKELLIKEAKVTKPAVASIGQSENVKISQAYVANKTPQHCSENGSAMFQNPKTIEMTSNFANKNGNSCHMVKEAKLVLNVNFPQQEAEPSRMSVASEQFLQPPPYHIAAAYSKKAAFFNQPSYSNTQFVQYGIIKEDNSSIHMKELNNTGPVVKAEDRNLSYIPEKEVDSTRDTYSNSDNLRENVIHGKMSVELSVAKNLPGKLSEVEEAKRSIASEDENLHQRLCDPKQDSNEVPNLLASLIPVQSLDPNTCEENSNPVSEDDSKAFCNSVDSELKLSEAMISLPDDTMKTLPSQESSEFEEELSMKTPQMFTQDKPIVCENIVAPTPQRPSSMCNQLDSSYASAVTTPAGSSNPPSPPYSAQNSHSVDLRNTYLESQDLCKPNLIDMGPPINVKKHSFPSHMYLTNNFPNYPSGKPLPLTSYSNSRPSSIASHHNSRPGSISSYHNIPMGPGTDFIENCNKQYLKPCVNEYDRNLLYSDIPRVTSSPITILENHSTDEGTRLSERSINALYRTPSFSRTSAGNEPPYVSTSPLTPRSSSGSSGKHKLWMFGRHKNATVFPVVLRKNQYLGFSIKDGAKTSASDKIERGIYVLKVDPLGPAEGLLCPEDKILEVDGIDFTKITSHQALTLLKQSGNVVNMMISRLQI